MNKPLSSISIIPKNEAFFCVQCECYINTERCPICYSQTLNCARVIDEPRMADAVALYRSLGDTVTVHETSGFKSVAQIVDEALERLREKGVISADFTV